MYERDHFTPLVFFCFLLTHYLPEQGLARFYYPLCLGLTEMRHYLALPFLLAFRCPPLFCDRNPPFSLSLSLSLSLRMRGHSEALTPLVYLFIPVNIPLVYSSLSLALSLSYPYITSLLVCALLACTRLPLISCCRCGYYCSHSCSSCV